MTPGPKIMLFIFLHSENTKFDVTICGFWGAKMPKNIFPDPARGVHSTPPTS